MHSHPHIFLTTASPERRDNGGTCASSASLLLGFILSKIEVMLYKVVKVLNPRWDGNTLFAFTTLSLCGACVVSHISCDLSILFVAFFYKIVETSPNVLQR